MLTPVVAVLALASVGATYENIAVRRDQDTYAAPGEAATRSAATGCTWTAAARAAPPSCSSTASARSPPPGPGSPARVGSDHPGLRLRPRRTGLERRRPRSPQDGVTAAKDLHTLLAVAGETRALRAGRALDRRHLRHDVRRPVPRAGRRHGAAGQLQPRAVHPDPRLPRSVRRDAPRPRAAAHAGPPRRWAGCSPALTPARPGRRPGPGADLHGAGRPERT